MTDRTISGGVDFGGENGKDRPSVSAGSTHLSLTWESFGLLVIAVYTFKSGIIRTRPFPGSEAKVLARACLSGLHKPALELSFQGIDSFSLEKWRKEAII